MDQAEIFMRQKLIEKYASDIEKNTRECEQIVLEKVNKIIEDKNLKAFVADSFLASVALQLISDLIMQLDTNEYVDSSYDQLVTHLTVMAENRKTEIKNKIKH